MGGYSPEIIPVLVREKNVALIFPEPVSRGARCRVRAMIVSCRTEPQRQCEREKKRAGFSLGSLACPTGPPSVERCNWGGPDADSSCRVPRRMIRTGGVRSQHLRPGGDVRVVVTFFFVLFENVLQLLLSVWKYLSLLTKAQKPMHSFGSF